MRTRRNILAAAIIAAAALTSTAAQSATWVQPKGPAAASESATCAFFSSISGTFDIGPGATNGIPVLPSAGERFTISVAGPGSGSFRIVGDAGGLITFAGPANVPATLSYVATSSLPANTQGVGFYFDSGQGSVTLTASCQEAISPAPALGGRGMLLLGALLALVGGTFGSRRLRASVARTLRR